MAGTAKTLISIISRRSGRKGLNDDSPGLSAPESPGPRRGEDRDRTLLRGGKEAAPELVAPGTAS